MAKIMLVEDDNNLREIYGARLLAEGHDIVAAQDGEEALALAVKEKPDLIISDVMMPRISGFDMLDILRNAPETKETKVIMMTALSQAEDKARADKLGADRYLVKSQVTLEDVANVVREVLDEGNTAEAPPAEEPAVVAAVESSTPPVAVPTPTPAPEPVVAAPVAPAPVAPAPVAQPAPAPTPVVAATPTPVQELAPAPTIPEIQSLPEAPAPTPAGLATVEQIANPEVEMPDDSELTPVQAPPTPIVAAEPAILTPPVAVPTPAPAPEPVVAAPVAPAPVAQPAPAPQPVVAATPTAVTPTIQPTTTVSAAPSLPPVVEPAAPIKVELPKPLDETREQITPAPAANQPTTAAPPASDNDDSDTDKQTGVGPSLLEALQAEENVDPNSLSAQFEASEQKSELPQSTESETPAPTIANGLPVQGVISPTQPVVQQTNEAPAEPAASTFESAAQDGGGVKRVIQPLAESSTPDINALLAAEEQKAAVENPVASTVIKPLPPAQPTAPAQPQAPAPAPTPAPNDDDVNSIAL